MRFARVLAAVVSAILSAGAAGQATDAVDLLAPGASAWAAGVDRGDTTVAAEAAGRGLAVMVKAAGGPEGYPKISRSWPAAQDWSRFLYLRMRVRVTCDAPGVTERPLNVVF